MQFLKGEDAFFDIIAAIISNLWAIQIITFNFQFEK